MHYHCRLVAYTFLQEPCQLGFFLSVAIDRRQNRHIGKILPHPLFDDRHFDDETKEWTQKSGVKDSAAIPRPRFRNVVLPYVG